MPAMMSSGGDDLQTQVLLRDQLHAMPQQHQLHAAHYAAQQASGESHPGYVQDRSGSSLSAAMSASGGVGLHAHASSLMQQQAPRPATLSKAVAGVMATPKGWQERLDKLNTLSDALNRQVCARPLFILLLPKGQLTFRDVPLTAAVSSQKAAIAL